MSNYECNTPDSLGSSAKEKQQQQVFEIWKKNWIPLRMISAQISIHYNSNTGLTKFRNEDQPNRLTFWPCNINILPNTLRALFDPRNKKYLLCTYIIISMQGYCTFYQTVVIFILTPNEEDMRASCNHEKVSIGERITTCKEVNQTNRLQNGTLFEIYILQGRGRWILSECFRCSGSKMSPLQCSFDKIKIAFSFWVLVKIIDVLTISSKKCGKSVKTS